MKVYNVYTVILYESGATSLNLAATFDNQEDATNAAVERQGDFDALLECEIFAHGPDGPVSTGVSGGALVGSLGIAQVAHKVRAAEAKKATSLLLI